MHLLQRRDHRHPGHAVAEEGNLYPLTVKRAVQQQQHRCDHGQLDQDRLPTHDSPMLGHS